MMTHVLADCISLLYQMERWLMYWLIAFLCYIKWRDDDSCIGWLYFFVISDGEMTHVLADSISLLHQVERSWLVYWLIVFLCYIKWRDDSCIVWLYFFVISGGEMTHVSADYISLLYQVERSWLVYWLIVFLCYIKWRDDSCIVWLYFFVILGGEMTHVSADYISLLYQVERSWLVYWLGVFLCYIMLCGEMMTQVLADGISLLYQVDRSWLMYWLVV